MSGQVFKDLDTLAANRQLIAEIDDQILTLLERRTYAAQVIGDIKRQNKKPIYDPKTEKEKIEKLSSKCIYPGLVEVVWPVIMCYTRTIE